MIKKRAIKIIKKSSNNLINKTDTPMNYQQYIYLN
jgi:hypothetical protein